MKSQDKNAPAEEESEDLPAEKWLVAFRNPDSKKHPAGHVFVRQFYAQGYYEAYDAVMTHAENMGLEVLWFREKRSCEPFLNHNFPELESVCTYCNRKFNHSDPIPCSVEGCPAQFCSRECISDHAKMRHH